MQSSQWLYTSPAYAEALHRSEDHLLAAAAGPVVAVVDPYALERRAWFASPQGFTDASVTPTKAAPEHVNQSMRYSFETLKEFSMRDAGWTSTVRSIAWSPRCPEFADGGCLLAVVHTDNKVLLYSMPRKRSKDRLEFIADLTDSVGRYFSEQESWEVCDAPEGNTEEGDGDTGEREGEEGALRLRGGGRGRGRGRSSDNRRHAKRADDTPDHQLQIIQNFQVCRPINAMHPCPSQFPRDADVVLAASLEEGNDRRFRLDLPKVVLTLWLQLRSHFSEDVLPKYKKGEFMFGIDRHIFDRVMDHMTGLYSEALEQYNISRKDIEKRSRALIRNKAIMSFGHTPDRQGPSDSVLGLIGQSTRSETSTCHIKDVTIVSSSTAAVCVGDSNHSIRQVRPQSGKKRKSTGHTKARLISHFPKTVSNAVYDWRLSVLTVTSASWSPVLWGNTTFFVIGNKAGHIILWKLDATGQTHHAGDVLHRCRCLGAHRASTCEICSIKWTTVVLMDTLQTMVFVAVADVSGQVMLWMMHQESLTAPLMHGGWQVHRSDLRPVSSLTLHQKSGRRLQICIGKCGGAFSVWQSSDVAKLNADATGWFSEGQLYSRYDCHGNSVITGIVSDIINDWIVTVGLDGRIGYWTIEENDIIPVQCHTLQPYIGSGIEAFYGVTSSPCGLMLAVMKDLGNKQRDAQEQRVIWKRVAHGSIELISLLNFDGAETWRLVEGHMREALNQKIDPGCIRSFGNLMRMILMEDKGRNLNVEYLEENETDEDEAMDDVTSIAVDIAAQKQKQSKAQDLLQRILNTLVSHGHANWHPALSEIDVQRLRCAVLLYNTVRDIPGIELDQELIQKAERVILHHHAMSVLGYKKRTLPSTVLDSILPLQSLKADLWTAIQVSMATWIMTFKDDVHPALLKAAQLMTMHDDVHGAVLNFMGDDPIHAATFFEKISEEDAAVMRFDRCHVTLLPMEELICSPWKCDTCGRLCLTPRGWLLESKGMSNPDCMFCCTPLHQ